MIHKDVTNLIIIGYMYINSLQTRSFCKETTVLNETEGELKELKHSAEKVQSQAPNG